MRGSCKTCLYCSTSAATPAHRAQEGNFELHTNRPRRSNISLLHFGSSTYLRWGEVWHPFGRRNKEWRGKATGGRLPAPGVPSLCARPSFSSERSTPSSALSWRRACRDRDRPVSSPGTLCRKLQKQSEKRKQVKTLKLVTIWDNTSSSLHLHFSSAPKSVYMEHVTRTNSVTT